ncbi:MAG: integrase core domain-containing protein [Congregibacter sp.]
MSGPCVSGSPRLCLPQHNGMVERLIRSVKQRCIWLHNFASLDEARIFLKTTPELIGRDSRLADSRWSLSGQRPRL